MRQSGAVQEYGCLVLPAGEQCDGFIKNAKRFRTKSQSSQSIAP